MEAFFSDRVWHMGWRPFPYWGPRRDYELRNFRIDLSDTKFTEGYDVVCLRDFANTLEVHNLFCDKIKMGRFLRITKFGSGIYLGLCEVQVYGYVPGM